MSGNRRITATGAVCCIILATVALLSLPHSPTKNGIERQDSDDPSWFRDVTREVGLAFEHDAGPPGEYAMPQSIGSGAALFDFDGDGLLDVYLVNNGGPRGAKNRLFRQLAGGKFQDVSEGSGLNIPGYGMGTAVGDANNDGMPDVLVTQLGSVRLFLNAGRGKFRDVTEGAGLDNPFWGTSAAFVDYDRDGFLDLVVVNYVAYVDSHKCRTAAGRMEFCAPHPFPGSVTKLFRNRGANPTANAPTVRFEDVTLATGLGTKPGPGLGVTCADFDGDGWADIFVANDGGPNHLWLNRPNADPASVSVTPRKFSEQAVSRGVAFNAIGSAEANMGVALADADGDGLLDLFVTHVKNEQHTLWKSGPPGAYRDRTALSGLTRGRWRATGFGVAMADFNHDGSPDLAIVNGDIEAAEFTRPDAETVGALGPFWSQYAQRNQLFVNDGRGGFQDVSRPGEAWSAVANVGRGLAWGDVDGDGAIDMLVTSIAGPARLFRNVAPKHGHWLMVRAFDPALKRDAYGARIVLTAGGKTAVGLINPGQSYLCSNDPRAHFGLGAADHVELFTVFWPNGDEETFAGGPADRVVTLRRGEGRPRAK